MTVELRKDDTWPALTATLQQADGTPIDLTGSSVVFRMEDENGTEKINSTATIVTSSAGEVKYTWSSSDTDTLGRYEGEFIVTFSSGPIAHVPNTTYIPIYITDH